MQVKSIAECSKGSILQYFQPACQKYCRMLQGEHSAILSTCIKQPYVIKIFVLSIFEWPFYTGFTVHSDVLDGCHSENLVSLQTMSPSEMFVDGRQQSNTPRVRIVF